MNRKTIGPASRIQGLEEYYFSTKLREIREMNKTGIPVINLGIGSPDLAPADEVIRELQDSSAGTNMHGYQPYNGIPELRKSMADWYSRFYQVELDPEKEILPLFGSKEGLMHIAMAFLNPGDEALIPDPGYPAYQAVTRLAGATPRTYPLIPENDFLPDLEQIEQSGIDKVRIMWINYPHMPTGKLGSRKLYSDLIDFAHKHGILLVNDNPYSFILNEEPLSILGREGAKEVALELNSLSKSHNMAGWRIGMVAGKKEFLDYLMRFKSQMDSGMFRPMQLAAARALAAGPDWYKKVNEVYRERKDSATQLLDHLNCSYANDQAGLFVWARIPDREKSGKDLSERILLNARVFITPGFIFGNQGERNIRVSLCQPKEVIMEALDRIIKS